MRGHVAGPDGVLQVRFGGPAVRIGDHQGVFDHDVVEAGSFHRFRHVDVEIAIQLTAARCSWRVPFIGGEVHEPGKMEWFCTHGTFLIVRIR